MIDQQTSFHFIFRSALRERYVAAFPPWATMHRLWKVYGPLQQFASRIGGDFEVFANECISVAFNHYYRL